MRASYSGREGGLEDPLLELLEDALVGGPQHVVDLGHLVQLIGSGEERV